MNGGELIIIRFGEDFSQLKIEKDTKSMKNSFKIHCLFDLCSRIVTLSFLLCLSVIYGCVNKRIEKNSIFRLKMLFSWLISLLYPNFIAKNLHLYFMEYVHIHKWCPYNSL